MTLTLNTRISLRHSALLLRSKRSPNISFAKRTEHCASVKAPMSGNELAVGPSAIDSLPRIRHLIQSVFRLPDPFRQGLNPLQIWVLLCALGAGYVLAGKLGLQMAVFHPSATPVWPPTGISLAAFLLFGYWVWPAVFLGALVVNVTTVGSIVSSLGIATGNTLEGLVGAFLVNHFANGRKLFGQQGDTLKFVLLEGILRTFVRPKIGVTSLSLGG